MFKYTVIACLSLFSIQAMASCEDAKAKIDAKLQAKGVSSYTLEIVPVDNAPAAASGVAAAKATSGKIVGNCDNETKNIVYTRN